MTLTTGSTLESLLNSITTGIGDWGLKLVGALFTLIIGLWLVRFLIKGVGKAFEKRNVDNTLRPFLLAVISFGLKFFLFITIAGIVGVPTASFAALIAGIGIAIGAAFNGSLGHLASGIMLLIFRPFKVGDLIEVDGTLGIVQEISVFVTVLETFQNKTEIIPNGTITDGTITNITTKGNLRVDMSFNIRYGANVKQAQEVILNVMESDTAVMKDIRPEVKVNSLTDSSIELIALPYAEVENYWRVYWDTRQSIVEALTEAGFDAPYAHRVVEMRQV